MQAIVVDFASRQNNESRNQNQTESRPFHEGILTIFHRAGHSSVLGLLSTRGFPVFIAFTRNRHTHNGNNSKKNSDMPAHNEEI